jgi:RNA polymerase sigma-70 factor (ECF subfamily)
VEPKPVTIEEDQARFAAIVLPHMAQAYRLARWFTGNPTDAQDVVQEAATRAFRHIGSFAGVSPAAWTLTIVRNTANSWLRKHGREAPSNDAEDMADKIDPAETPESHLLRKADVETVRRAVAALPARYREVIVLREIDELDYREIPRIVDAPIGTVMSRLARGRRLLMRALGKV